MISMHVHFVRVKQDNYAILLVEIGLLLCHNLCHKTMKKGQLCKTSDSAKRL